MSKPETIILSLGGSLIVPNGGIDTDFLSSFNTFIRSQLSGSPKRFFIVCGGGGIARTYQKAARAVIGEITDIDVDWLGIHATRLNAHLMRTIFYDISYPVIIEDYERDYDIGESRVIVGAGWRPGCSTDYDGVRLATRFGAQKMINMSNVDMVYDQDPKIHPDAKPIRQWTWQEYRKLAGDTWIPGMNVPFDPIASEEAQEAGLTVVILNGKNLVNLGTALDGKEFVGTTIT